MMEKMRIQLVSEFVEIYLTDSVLVESQNDQRRRSEDQRSLHL